MLIWLLYFIVIIYDLWLFLFTISVTAVTQDVNWKRPKDGNSALHLSAEMGHIEADSVFFGWDFTCKKWWWKHQTTVMNAAHRCWFTQHMVIYPPVIKHGNWKSTINGAFNMGKSTIIFLISIATFHDTGEYSLRILPTNMVIYLVTLI